MSFPFSHLLQQMSIFCLFVLVILKHCCSSFHPFSNFQQVHFCKYSHEAESMEAAKSQFSYICLSCQVLLKERKRVLIIHVGRATWNYWEEWWETQLSLVLVRKEYAPWLILHCCFAFKKGWFSSVSGAGLILDLVLMIFTWHYCSKKIFICRFVAVSYEKYKCAVVFEKLLSTIYTKISPWFITIFILLHLLKGCLHILF